MAVIVGLVAIVAGCVVSSSSPAFADSAGPSDYRSEVVAVDPPTPSIEESIVGGDSFVWLRVAPGVEVDVTGYDSEPYLHIAAVPAVTDPRAVSWLLPVLAVAFAFGAWVLGTTPGGQAAAAIAGLS